MKVKVHKAVLYMNLTFRLTTKIKATLMTVPNENKSSIWNWGKRKETWQRTFHANFLVSFLLNMIIDRLYSWHEINIVVPGFLYIQGKSCDSWGRMAVHTEFDERKLVYKILTYLRRSSLKTLSFMLTKNFDFF